MKKRSISLLLICIMAVSLLIVPASAATMRGAVTTSSLNLRKGAGTSYAKITVMPKNAQVLVLSSSKGWCKLIYNNTVGYASASYLKSKSVVSGDFGTATVTGSDVRFRKGAGTSYAVLGSFAKGDKLTVSGANGNWYKVTYNGKTGYVSADYASVSATPAKTTKASTTYEGTITGSDVRIRKGAGTGYTILKTCAKGTVLTVTGSKGTWFAVTCNGNDGYVSGDYLRIKPKTVYTDAKNGNTTGAVNLRMGPASNFTALVKCSAGTKLTVTGIYGNWYEASVNGKTGYISKSYVELEPETQVGYVTGDEVRLRSGAGTEYPTLAYFDKGTELTITDKSGDWYAVTIDKMSGYMSAMYVSKEPVVSSPSPAASTMGEKIVAKAQEYVGVPYVYGGASPNGFDCSGLVYYVYGSFGYSIERGAGGQWLRSGKEVSLNKLQPGDLVFFRDDVDPISHVGMYIGDGQFIHASSSKGCVVIAEMDSYYCNEYLVGAKRIL